MALWKIKPQEAVVGRDIQSADVYKAKRFSSPTLVALSAGLLFLVGFGWWWKYSQSQTLESHRLQWMWVEPGNPPAYLSVSVAGEVRSDPFPLTGTQKEVWEKRTTGFIHRKEFVSYLSSVLTSRMERPAFYALRNEYRSELMLGCRLLKLDRSGSFEPIGSFQFGARVEIAEAITSVRLGNQDEYRILLVFFPTTEFGYQKLYEPKLNINQLLQTNQ